MKKVREKENNKIFITSVVIVIQIILCIAAGTFKHSFFCDEIYSYGLANSENYAFIDPETAKQYSETGWVDRQYFEDYIQVSKDVPFSFHAAFENQKKDVHPPLYYCLLHIVSLLNGGVFTKWTGLALNFLFLILADLVLLYISDYLLKDRKLSYIVLLFWTFSGAGFSNILLIRMYVMLTFEMLVYAAIHIQILKNSKIKLRNSLSLFLIVLCGGLTHYYFYFFALFFSVPICLYLMLQKKIKTMFFYGIHLCAGAGTALCIFPSTIDHVFYGYRGVELINNMKQDRSDILQIYLEMMNNSMFAGIFQICFGFMILLLIVNVILKYFINIEFQYNKKTRIVKMNCKRRKNGITGEIQFMLKDEFVFECLLIASYCFFALAVIKGSNLIHNRYLYPIYPVVALVMIQIFNSLLRSFLRPTYIRIIALSVISGFLCIGSVLKYGIDFRYVGYDAIEQQAEQYSGTDCLLYYGDGWLDVYTVFPLRMLHENTYFMRTEQLNQIEEILSTRETSNDLTVCMSSSYSEEDARNILDTIMAQTGHQSCKKIYNYAFLQEWLIE